jgi:hypothetical protein
LDWMRPAVAVVTVAWREVQVVAGLAGLSCLVQLACPAGLSADEAGAPRPGMSVAGLARRYRVVPGAFSWAGPADLYLGRLVPTLYR